MMWEKGGETVSEYKGYSQQQNRATQKYLAEHREQVRIWVEKGKKQEYMEKAKAKGLSLTAYIVGLIESDK